MTTSVALLEVNATNVQKAYIAYYGRPADPAGLNFWTTAGTSSTTMLTIMRDFGASAEFAALYGSGTNAAFVNAIYRNVFGRNADADGLNFYVNALTNGSITRADVVFNVLNGATGADATIVANKVEFATQYTTALSSNVSAYVNYDATFGIPQARTALSGVTADSTAAQITASVNTSVTTVAAGSIPAPTTGNTFNLTTTVETVSGTAYSDTINGSVGTTFQAGDIIQGNGGNDTLSLLANNPGGSVTAQLDSVESVNIRVITSAALDLVQWSGTNTITLTSESVSGSTLVLSNMADGQRVEVERGATLRLDLLDDSGTSDSFNVKVSNPQPSGGSIVIDGSAAAVTTLNLAVSGNASDAISVTYNGSSTRFINISGDANGGSLALYLDDQSSQNSNLSSISYAGFSGTTTTYVSASSKLAFTGGAGNDTLSYAGKGYLTAADTLNGGAGTDTLQITLDGAVLTGVSNFERLEAALISADVDTTFSSISRITITGGTAAQSVYMSGLDDGANVKVNLATGNRVTLGYSGSNATVDFSGVSAGAELDFARARVTGAATVNLNFGAATATNNSFSILSTDAATTVNIDVSKSAVASAAQFYGSGADVISLRASGDGAVLNLAALQTSGLSTLSLTTVGSAQAAIGAVSGLGDATIANLTIGASGHVSLGSFNASVDGADVTATITVGKDAGLSGSPDFELVSGAATITLSVGQSANVALGSAGAGAGSIGAMDISVAARGSASIAAASGNTVSTILISGGVGAYASLGTVRGSGVGSIDVRAGVSAGISLDAVSSTTVVGAVSGTVGAYGSARLAGIRASGSLGAINLTAEDGADLVYGSAASFGSAGGIGNITVTGGSASQISLVEFSAGTNVGNITFGASDAASASIGKIQSLSGSVGTISLTAGSATTISVSTILAETTVGAITLTGSGSNVGGFAIGSINTSASVASISVASNASAQITSISAASLTSVSWDGQYGGSANFDANSIGSFTFNGSAGTFVFAGTTAQSVGDVLIRGSGQVTFDFNNASSITSISTVGRAGTASIDLSGVRSGVSQITLGNATNLVVLGTASDVIDLSRGTGKDRFYFVSGDTGPASFDRDFEFGGTNDSLNFGTAGFKLGLGSATSNNSAGTLDVMLASAGNYVISLNSAGASSDDATDIVIFADSAFTSVADMVSSLSQFTLSSTGSAASFTAGQLLVLWYNDTTSLTELSVITASSNALTMASAVNAANVVQLATFEANIATVSAASFNQFNAYNNGAIPG